MLTLFMAAFTALWLLGMVTSHTMGGFIHVLPAAVVFLLLAKIFRDRRPATG
jgi:F0F1-type ATP synthase assembly protein I